ncbi:MAG: cation:proton antiporter [Synergistaceae bacterium]|jgi:multicomponent Na+:H+ antiporter subunit G|nr:cation:proton antiporter [Synergistaceae bacterium]
MNTAIGILLGIGLLFNVLGTVSLYRFPDVYTRLHGTTKCTTFGSLFTSAAVVVYGLTKFFQGYEGRFVTLSLHVLVAVLALLISNATGANAIARAAHRSGIMPVRAVFDRLAEDEKTMGRRVS